MSMKPGATVSPDASIRRVAARSGDRRWPRCARRESRRPPTRRCALAVEHRAAGDQEVVRLLRRRAGAGGGPGGGEDESCQEMDRGCDAHDSVDISVTAPVAIPALDRLTASDRSFGRSRDVQKGPWNAGATGYRRRCRPGPRACGGATCFLMRRTAQIDPPIALRGDSARSSSLGQSASEGLARPKGVPRTSASGSRNRGPTSLGQSPAGCERPRCQARSLGCPAPFRSARPTFPRPARSDAPPCPLSSKPPSPT